MIQIDVHGSCVSRNIFNEVPMQGDIEIVVDNYLSRNNVISCMMPPAEFGENINCLLPSRSEYSNRCLKYAIDKSTISILLNSESQYLVVDYFDLCQRIACFKNTTFSIYDGLFYHTNVYKNHSDYIFELESFFEIPEYLWYGYIDLYWQNIIGKYEDNVILVKLHCCSKFISKNKTVENIPNTKLAYGNAKYNAELDKLENYIIERYNPYVIDVSKYFIADEAYNEDVTPVHFEQNYTRSAWKCMQDILKNGNRKYYDDIPASVLADILAKPITNGEFRLMWQDIVHFFHCCDLIDDLLNNADIEQVISNRMWLSQIYQKAGGIDNFNLDNNEEDKRKLLYIFIKEVINIPAENKFQEKFLERIVMIKRYMEVPLNKLIQSFLDAFDVGNMEWIPMLKCLQIMMPNDPTVLFYSYQYYSAIDDEIKATIAQHRMI